MALAEGAIADPSVAIIGSDGEPTGTRRPTFAFSTGDDLFDPLDYEGRPPESDDEIVIDGQTSENEGFGIGDMVEVAGKTEASENRSSASASSAR